MPKNETTRTGGCLCGAVTFEADGVRTEAGACHCSMCLRFSGGPWVAVGVEAVRFTKGEPAIYESSDWAERGFCRDCGSSLFYRFVMEGSPHRGNTFFALGSLDDSSGIELASEMFIDSKPEAYAFAGDHPRVTEAEAKAAFDD